MEIYIFIEFVSFFSLVLFSLMCFLKVDNNIDTNKLIYLFNLVYLSITSLFHYFYVLNFFSNDFILIISLLIVITFFIFLILSIFSYQFIRLRILFIPFFFILIIFRFVIGVLSFEDAGEVNLFDNHYLLIHILTSLLSYSLITISLVTAFCIFIQDIYIKKMKYNQIINNFLPSMFESEMLAIRFLYLTIIFLIISLISGYYYFIENKADLTYFFNQKVILSLITLFLTVFIILFRSYKGLSGQMIFKMILLSYLFISFSYFGIKLLG